MTMSRDAPEEDPAEAETPRLSGITTRPWIE